MRFGGNLVLTRLLFPEAFGLMTLVTALMVGAAMLTDIGITPGVVRDARGEDPAFLHTAWLLQIGHGVVMTLAMCVLAGPMASHFAQPELTGLIFATAMVPLISGFASINLALASRRVQSRPLVMLEMAVQLTTLLIIVALALWQASVWAIVWGNVAGALLRVGASHLFVRGVAARLKFDRSAARSIMHFGGWVTINSTLTFAVGEGSKLIGGSILSLKTLGLLGIATGLSGLMVQAVHMIVSRSLFPAYAEVFRSGDMPRFARMIERSRAMQVGIGCTVCIALSAMGPWIVQLLYDKRYADAGRILQILAWGQIGGLLAMSYGGVLWAMSKVKLSAALLAIQTLATWLCMWLGNRWGGEVGVIWGMAAANFVTYPVHAFVYYRLGLFSVRVDLPALAASAALLALLLTVL